ncbi:hypothetical protein MFUM_700032 [Methylacidiphilum fumariolicum SolV]|uniref:Uncharacterized protein n=2 Tax=Candidatus Methylacidiphilum fumarolicum TaxID=591154 RepID=I0JZ14_METFB|nr:conserved protein of unknown function [Candidatus Methylacidiphilum fumarolicum]CCG92483.1 hypothetical protein MFUM_700032 [Methylacidiphilum fumariolicum SolV]
MGERELPGISKARKLPLAVLERSTLGPDPVYHGWITKRNRRHASNMLVEDVWVGPEIFLIKIRSIEIKAG